MFNVNTDKLTSMTFTEKNSYREIADTFISQYGKECPGLALIGGGLKAFKLASVIMEMNYSVLFIDADLSSDVFLGKYRLGKNLLGITDYMKHNNQDYDVLEKMICKTNHEKLDVVFTGSVDNAGITAEEELVMVDILEKYKQSYDFIIVDSEENGNTAKYCDGTLVIIDEADYVEAEVQNLVDELDENGCKVLGVIINE